MKKFLLLVFAFVLIFGGIYGTYYFFKLKKAEIELNRSVADIHDGNYESAVNTLKNVISQFDYTPVKAPALYLLADTYEKMGRYSSSLETHESLITNERISSSNNWHIRSIISVSKLYRNNLVKTSIHRTELLENHIQMIKKKLEEKKKRGPFSELQKNMKKVFYSLLSSRSSLFTVHIDDKNIIQDLETELGFLYLNIQKYEEAEAVFKKFDTVTTRFGLAQLYLETGEHKKGIDILEELLPFDSTGKIQSYYIQELYEYAENLFDQERFIEGIALFKKIEKITRDSIFAELSYFRLAQYYYKTRKYGNALQYIDKIIKNTISEKDEDAYLLKGFIYYDRRDYINALKTFNGFIRRFPESKHIQTARDWKAMCERSIKYLD